MKSLRVRLTLWFTAGFLAVVAVFMFFTYRSLDLQLRRDTFSREERPNPNWILHGSYSEEEVQDIMAQLLQSSLRVSLPAVLLVILLGYFIARQSLRPIETVNRQLREISPRTLGRRVDLKEGDEQFISLQRHLNEMLGRLEGSFSEMREYAAKVAHELRTPLTILRHKVEQSQGRIDPDLAEDLQEELLRLSHVVDQSLLIAKAGQGRLAWDLQPFDLALLLRDLVQDFALLAAAEDRLLELHAEGPCPVVSDARYCKQILHALLNNALIHGRGAIRIRLARRRERARLILINPVRSGPAPSELTLGLGLRVVRALVAQQPSLHLRQHHGREVHATGLSFPVQRLVLSSGLALFLACLPLPAEDQVDYKFEYYAEDNARIQVRTHSLRFETDLTPRIALKGSAVYDGISGATPAGGPPVSGRRVATATIEDVRTAGALEGGFRFGAHRINPQLAYSTEEDYQSLAPSLNYVVDLFRRNTSLNLGAAHSFDRSIRGIRLSHAERKDATDVLGGVTQVLTPTTLLNLTVTIGTASGYLSDPYKGFRFTLYPDPNTLFPERRPGHRTKQIVSTTLTQSVEPAQGSAELTYRFYHDSFGLFGHTATLEWLQHLGRWVVLAPLLRYYEQSAADFYRLQFAADPSDNVYGNLDAIPQFYSSDYRLSRLRTWTYGVGLRVRFRPRWFAEVAYKRYAMQGLDGLTASSNYPQADVYTVGVQLHF